MISGPAWKFQPKLTVYFAVLFLVIFVPTIFIVHAAVIGAVTRSVERELIASGAVFNRIIALRGSQLEESATILSSDFGFRSAVATRDIATIESALENIVARIDANHGFVVDLEGRIVASTNASSGGVFLFSDSLREEEAFASAGVLEESPYVLVASPIRAPLTIAWVVFAIELDAAATSELEALSPIPLHAQVMTGAELSQLSELHSATQGAQHNTLSEQDISGVQSLVHVENVPVIEGSPNIGLVLAHAKAVAFQPYRQMVLIIILLGAAGVALLAAGCWLVAKRVTRPLSALSDAVALLRDGQRASVDVTSTDEFGDLAAGFNLMSEEISSREQAITHMALHDSETGLPNRTCLQNELAKRREHHSTPAAMTLLIGVRLKRFANIRAAIGYDLSAEVLNTIARRLSEDFACSRLTVDTLATLHTVALGCDVEDYCQTLHKKISEAVAVDALSIDMDMVVGVVDLTGAVQSPEKALQSLELAIDYANNKGASFAEYSAAVIPDPIKTLTLMGAMQEALKTGDIRLHYQPKVGTRSGRVEGVEALLRWIHPELGFIPPDAFVEMAEETGHIADLTEWVVDRALADQRRFADCGVPVSMAVNVSGRLLANDVFANFAIDAVERHGASADQIVLEITETAVMDNPEVAIRQLERLRHAGFALAIDDYGTGLSSLSYLKELPVSELKIDKSFVLALASDEQDKLLVKSSIDLAHSLGLKVTAEGVEDQESFAALQLFGCEYAQGYFFSKAVPADEFIEFATGWHLQSQPIERQQNQAV